ncbi:MAG: hypothetical protein JXM70_10485 [Pirellulales bacterium]|nr:hypothetical protein [Pirellulales bacterium]
MKTHRGIIRLTTFLAIGLFLALLIGSAWVYSSQLPDPEHADRGELIRWMVTRDLRQESPRTREVLALRLEKEFVDVDWEGLGSQMSTEHRRRLWANLPLILEPWFMHKLEDYSNRDANERQQCVDAIIDRMTKLSGMNCLRDQSTDQSVPKLKELMFEQIEVWKKRADPEEKKRIGQFFAAIQARWLIRKLSGDTPSARH